MATSYANAGGTGDRTGSITVTTTATLGGGTPSNLVDGAKANNTTDAMWWNSGQSGRRLTFYFNGDSKLIDEAKWYQNGPSSNGDWKWQGGNNGSSWTDLSASFTLSAGGAGDVVGDLSGNSTGYLYYSLLQVSGTTNDGPWLWEMEFKIDAAAAGANEAVLNATEAPDIAAIAGQVITTIALAATDAPDTANFVQLAPVTGTLAITDAPDAVALTGVVGKITVVLATQEAGDVVSITNNVIGQLVAIEAEDAVTFGGTVRRHPYPVIVVSAN